MNHLSLRLTYTTDCGYADVLAYLKKQFKIYAICDEIGKSHEKPHCHCYVLTDKKVDTHRKQVAKLTKLAKGNQLFSFVKIKYKDHIEILDGYNINYLSYLQKQKNFVFEGIPANVKLASIEFQAAVAEDIRLKKEKKESRYKRIVRLFEDENKLDQCDCHQVIEWLIDFFVKEECQVSVSTIETWTNTLLMKYNIDNYRSNLNTNICKRLFKI